MHILTAVASERAWGRGSWFIRRAALKAVALSLYVVVAAIAAAATRAERPVREILALRTEESTARNIASVMQTRSLELRKFETPLLHPAMTRRMERFHWGGCGSGYSLVVEPRLTKLPGDPLLVLGDGYLKCRMIRAALLEPEVSVASYPPGYFGDYKYEGLLVTDWFEFSDEEVMQRIFQLLAELAKAPDSEDVEIYFEDPFEDAELKLADYRTNTGFFPEFVFEFVGDAALKIEINLTFGRLLVHAAEKWDGYSIDQPSGAALKTLLEAKRKKTGSNRELTLMNAN